MLQRRVGGTRALAHSIWCFNQIYRCFSWFRHHSTCLNHQRTHPSTHHPRPAHHPRNGPEFGRFRPASRSPKALLNCFTKLFQSFRVFQSFNNVCQLSQFSKHSTGLSFWGVLYSQTNKVFRYPICIRTLYIYISSFRELVAFSPWKLPQNDSKSAATKFLPCSTEQHWGTDGTSSEESSTNGKWRCLYKVAPQFLSEAGLFHLGLTVCLILHDYNFDSMGL